MSSDLVWLQGGLITLVGLFDWLCMVKNVGKMVIMVCRPCQAAITHSEAAYERQMTGVGLYYQEIQQVQVQCS